MTGGSSDQLRPDKVDWLGIGLNESSKYNASGAKARSLRPKLVADRYELSSYCMDGLSEAARWELLDLHSDKPPIRARAEFNIFVILEAGLTTEIDWEPPRHVNIVGWPNEEERRKSAQQVLVARQIFVSR